MYKVIEITLDNEILQNNFIYFLKKDPFSYSFPGKLSFKRPAKQKLKKLWPSLTRFLKKLSLKT